MTKSNHFLFLIAFFLSCDSQKGICLSAALLLKVRPQILHLTVVDSSAWLTCFFYYSVIWPPLLFALRMALRLRDSAFHLGTFCFLAAMFFFCSVFLWIASPFLMNCFCYCSTSRCYWVLNYFLLFWNTFLHIF